MRGGLGLRVVGYACRVLLAGDQASFLTSDLDSVGVMERNQRAQMSEFFREKHVVYLLARPRPHVHVGWTVARRLDRPQGGDDFPVFIGEYRDLHMAAFNAYM
jgi:hypothetical protein